MRPLTLVLIVHDHQPVGNFDHVIERAHADAYAPFLAFLERHEGLRIALHTSGPLLEWLEAHDRGYLTRLRRLVEAGRIEPWGGGFYEPILAAIPERDRRGQIERMAAWLARELGRAPRGAWLTERVWEPGLAASLARAGVSCTAADDAHFLAAGLDRDQLWGHFITEDQGERLAILPIHRELRYAVPFREPEEVLAILERIAAGGEQRIAVLGDDGEKFGVWPGTRKLCYEDGWLERFAALLETNRWVEVRTPAESLAHHRPRGLVYLPTASYHELEEWALTPAAQQRYERAASRLEGEFGDQARDLLRGGHWRGFLARYPEASRLHQRAIRASGLLDQPGARRRRGAGDARQHLWRAQCNDVYWHGVFGGLYLPHLRAAAYRELIAAERFAAGGGSRLECSDLDGDGFDDALIEGPAWAAWISARGGALWGLDDRRRGFNYADTLARRPEAYHARLREGVVGGGEGETIHAVVRLKEPGLTALLEGYDPRGRESFLDRWLEAGESRDLGLDRYSLGAAAPDAVVLSLDEGAAPAIEKRYARAGEDALEVLYTVSSGRARQGTLEVELNLGLHVARADDRYVEVDGRRDEPPHLAAASRHAGVTSTAFVDAWAGRRLAVEVEPACAFTRAPIETVSLSEGGAERVFQGIEARYRFEAALAPGRPLRLRFRLTLAAAAAAPSDPRPAAATLHGSRA